MLQAFERAGKDIDYYALDLSRPELERTLAQVEGVYQHVHCHGLFGTYDDGLAWLKEPENQEKPKCILWMGSSVGNLTRPEAVDFMKGFSQVLRGQDVMLIGVDACQDKGKIYHAYNDREGKTHEFDLNGLAHANRLVGKKVFNRSDWKIIGEYDEDAGRHQAFYSPVRDVVVEGIPIKAGERIRFEESYKYSLLQSGELWRHAGLMELARFGNRINEYRKWIFSAVRMCQNILLHTSTLESIHKSYGGLPSFPQPIILLVLQFRVLHDIIFYYIPYTPDNCLLQRLFRRPKSTTYLQRWLQIYTLFPSHTSLTRSRQLSMLHNRFQHSTNLNSYGRHGI